MLRILLVALSVSLLACSNAAPPRPAALSEAFTTARLENKVVVVDFFATWCGPCKLLESQTWSDASVQQWFDAQAVLVKLDAEQERALASHYDVEAYPTIVFMKPDGSVIESLRGFRDPNTFLAEARRIVAN